VICSVALSVSCSLRSARITFGLTPSVLGLDACGVCAVLDFQLGPAVAIQYDAC